MEKELNRAITKATEVLKELNELKNAIEQSKMFDGSEKATFIRFDVQGYPGYPTRFLPGKWMEVLDGNKSRVVVKSRSGFEVRNITKNQTVDSTKNTANMLFSKDNPSVELAITVLDTLADAKYNKKEK